MVSVPAFYSDDPSSIPAGYLINFLYEKTKINEKEAGVGPFKKKVCSSWRSIFIECFRKAKTSNPALSPALKA